jgi:glucosamine-6-phosphate deaminase
MFFQEFDFDPSKWIPFRDKAELQRVMAIEREDMEKHSNPEFRITVVPDARLAAIRLTDMFYRIKAAMDQNEQLVIILGNPSRSYIDLAHMINRFNVRCATLHVFIMDEWADEEGNIAPESYPQGFMCAFKNYFYKNLLEDLRPPERLIHGPTNQNIDVYGKMIEDMGGADICYSGPGWTGHIAFIDPDAPEFEADFEEWKTMSSRIVTLSPFTIAQNSLHGSFGSSGAMAFVPPKAATIGPAEVVGAKERFDTHALTTAGTYVSWQRFATRLCLHGPVTPLIPGSLLQTLPTQVYVSESCAATITPIWEKEY